jgi:hypothetical protein
VYFHNWSDAIVNGLLIFSWWDVLKLGIAVAAVHSLSLRSKVLGQ